MAIGLPIWPVGTGNMFDITHRSSTAHGFLPTAGVSGISVRP
jgi:hypothetical protein